jgi:hypothetical protein
MEEQYGMLWYQSYLFVVLLLGLVFGMVGFWRLGASFANDLATRNGAITTSTPDDIRAWQVTLFEGFTGGDIASYDASSVEYSELVTNRMVFSRLSTHSDWAGGLYVGAQSQVRDERFFPGREKCYLVGGTEICHE